MAYRERNPMLGALAGAIGGLAGSWTMVQFNHLIRPNNGAASDRPGDRSAHRRVNARPNDTDGTTPDEPGSIQAAETLAEPVLGRELTEREKQIGGSAVHYLFGATVGAIYGASAEIKPETAAGAGIPFGTTVWLVADEMGMPLVGFASNPIHYPASRHAAAFASHVVYGLTVEGVRRLLRGGVNGERGGRRARR
jgi:putative membrane protein